MQIIPNQKKPLRSLLARMFSISLTFHDCLWPILGIIPKNCPGMSRAVQEIVNCTTCFDKKSKVLSYLRIDEIKNVLPFVHSLIGRELEVFNSNLYRADKFHVFSTRSSAKLNGVMQAFTPLSAPSSSRRSLLFLNACKTYAR